MSHGLIKLWSSILLGAELLDQIALQGKLAREQVAKIALTFFVLNIYKLPCWLVQIDKCCKRQVGTSWPIDSSKALSRLPWSTAQQYWYESQRRPRHQILWQETLSKLRSLHSGTAIINPSLDSCHKRHTHFGSWPALNLGTDRSSASMEADQACQNQASGILMSKGDTKWATIIRASQTHPVGEAKINSHDINFMGPKPHWDTHITE